MAIRRWAARPDQALTLQDGSVIPVVSREQMREAFLDGEALMAQSGGVFMAYAARERTDLDGEMVTTSAVFEWKDRADARPQPEQPVAQTPAAVPEPTEADLAAELAAAGAVPAPAEPDAEPEEDLSSIPAHLQGVV